MPANTSPIFPLAPRVGWLPIALIAAVTTYDGVGASTVFTAGANGSRVDYVKIRARGTNAATVLRLFINNGLTNATAANNVLFVERSIAATSASTSTETPDVYIPLDISLPAGYSIQVTLGIAIAAGVAVTAVGGDY